jgi:pimeloyl-ACP methyl ester carboxylesterase
MIDGLTVGVQVVGQGQPVLLLHGWGANRQAMLPIAERLAAQGFECHCLDFPGFGQSQTPAQAWDVERYARFIVAYLESAGLEQVHLIGHSFGGRVSIVLGADFPERVQKLVLTDSAGVKPTPTGRLRLYYASRRVIFALLKLPLLSRFEPPVRERLRQRYGSADYKAAGPLTETFKRVVNQDLLSHARRIQAPTLLIWGDQDQDTPLKDAKLLETVIKDAGLVVFEGAGHYAYLERPADFARIVAYFFLATVQLNE